MTFRIILLLGIQFSVLFCGCEKRNKLDKEQMVRDYFDALNESNLSKANSFLIDSVVLSEFEFIQLNSKERWVTQFKWDSVFSPKYKILELEKDGELIRVTISKNCKRIRFLHDSAIIYQEVFEFKNDLISSESTSEYLVFDNEKWVSRRDSLVLWVDANYPEISGFIYDQSIKGGQDYLKAIELYENR